MTILAITTTGKEFFYNGKTAHKAAPRNAEKIAEKLNALRYGLKDGQEWHVYEIDIYDNAVYYAVCQSFCLKNDGTICRKRHTFPATESEMRKRVYG